MKIIFDRYYNGISVDHKIEILVFCCARCEDRYHDKTIKFSTYESNVTITRIGEVLEINNCPFCGEKFEFIVRDTYKYKKV